jgi:hypothetical protein
MASSIISTAVQDQGAEDGSIMTGSRPLSAALALGRLLANQRDAA